jgi:nucleotide-binding universal stress UspA family protein
MKNILLLTDFSDNSRNAIEYALKFFRGFKYNFFILNVHKVSKYTTADLMSSSKDETIYDSIVKNPKAELNKMIEEYKQRYSSEDYLFKSICDYDVFVSAVKQTVNLQGIDLIIMGTNGATGAMEVIFGSNTVSVIRNIDCPVLVIPQGFRFRELNKILFTTEFNETIYEKSLKTLQRIIDKHQTELDILILNKEDILPDSLKSKKNRLNSFFKGYKLNYYTITNVPIDFAMNCFEQIKKVDLIAKIINKESFLKRLVSGSKTDNITYESRVPLLIMHPK